MKMKLLLGLCLWTGMNTLAAASLPGDSVGVKQVGDKKVLLVRVVSGDNLSSLARQFGTSVEKIREMNQLSGTQIQLGQVLQFPMRAGASNPTKPTVANVAPTKPSPEIQKHKVAPGESLFAVSKKYGVTVDQIKKWNNLTSDGLNVGQVLVVSDPAATANVPNPTPSVNPDTGNSQNPPDAQTIVPNPADTAVAAPGTHIVKPGESLYGIARLYNMEARDLKVLNKLEDPNLKVGQILKVKMDLPANPNQGKALMNMIGEASGDSGAVKEIYPDLRVLTASATTMVPPEAKVTTYRDKATGKTYRQIEEEGTVGPIEDFVTDQTKFYAFHRYLPVGSYVRIDFPEKGQSILAEVTNQLPPKDAYTIRLSAKCLDYLMVRKPGSTVKVKYVLPLAN